MKVPIDGGQLFDQGSVLFFAPRRDPDGFFGAGLGRRESARFRWATICASAMLIAAACGAASEPSGCWNENAPPQAVAMAVTENQAKDNRASLVFGIVAATGTQVDRFLETMKAVLNKFGYEPAVLQLSSLLQHHVLLPGDSTEHDEGTRIEKLMNAGDELRQRMRSNDAMARLAVLGIKKRSAESHGRRPIAYLLRQLKHPEEVSLLREVYGDSFFSISIYSTSHERKQHLVNFHSLNPDRASELIRRDEDDEQSPHGQKTRDTFELGDFFIRIREGTVEQTEVERFLDLIFGRPDLSPFLHEHAMYLAYASSLRSADLSRQVGAAVISPRGDLLAVGANDVPTYGGGQYWPGDRDHRDHKKGYDSNAAHRDLIAKDIFERLRKQLTSTGDDHYSYDRFIEDIKGCKLFDITEYGRAVHAEMDAVLACARVGVSSRGATLFCTTFPCHNCAKHIVDAGIVEVQYVEAYPKSKAEELHSDAIHFEDHHPFDSRNEVHDKAHKVVFRHYSGVGPRRYMDLYSLALSSGRKVKRKKEVVSGGWDRTSAAPRVPSAKSISDKENDVILTLGYLYEI